MGQCSAIKAEWDPLSLDILLTTAGHDLRDVQVATLGASAHHVLQSVGRSKSVQHDLTGFVTGDVQLIVHHHFE